VENELQRKKNKKPQNKKRVSAPKPKPKPTASRPKMRSGPAGHLAEHPTEVKRFVAAQVMPFNDAAKGAYVPNEFAKASTKECNRNVTTISVLASTPTFIFMMPNASNDAADAVYFTNGVLATSISAQLVATIATIQVPSPYTQAILGSDNDLCSRIGSAAMRFKYTGTTLNKGGTIQYLRLTESAWVIGPNGQLTTGSTLQAVLNEVNSNRLTVTTSIHDVDEITCQLTPPSNHDWSTSNLYSSSIANPEVVTADQTYATLTLKSATYGVIVINCPSASTFRVETVIHSEYKGTELASRTTPSSSHPSEHALLHSFMDRALETHNNNPDITTGQHIAATISQEHAKTSKKTSIFGSIARFAESKKGQDDMLLAANLLL